MLADKLVDTLGWCIEVDCLGNKGTFLRLSNIQNPCKQGTESETWCNTVKSETLHSRDELAAPSKDLS